MHRCRKTVGFFCDDDQGCLAAATAADKAVSLCKCVYGNSDEAENHNCYENVSDDIESLLPDLVAHADCLESAPETVCEVEAEGAEPYDVDKHHPPVLECLVEQEVRIGSVLAHELLELHFCPEVVEVECEKTENDDAQNEHVLRCP